MPRPLNQQVVVITGASSGIGRESALQFADAGARVVLAARNRKGLETLETEIRNMGGVALAVPTDVSDPVAVAGLAEAAIGTFGRIDTWVNNAAIALYAPFLETSLEEMRHQMDVDYWGAVHGFQAAIPRMRATGGGVIITVGSVLSDISVPLQSTYCAAKHALKGLTESIRIELLHDEIPIDVTLIKPPSTDTPFFRHALTKLGVAPKPLEPVYDPSVIAREIVRAAHDPQREVMVGGAGQAFTLLNKLMPSLYDRQQVRQGYADQMTDTPKSGVASNNFLVPVSEPGAVRDTGRGWKTSWVMWLEEHPKTAVAGLTVAAGAISALRGRVRK